MSTSYIFYNCRIHEFLSSGSAAVFDLSGVTGSAHLILDSCWVSGESTINNYACRIIVDNINDVADTTVTKNRSIEDPTQTNKYQYIGTDPQTLNYIHDGSSTISTSGVNLDNNYCIVQHDLLQNKSLAGAGVTYGHLNTSILPTSSGGLSSGDLFTQTATELGGTGTTKIICVV